ncbi:MAG: Grx4 family monothiol glutaredoxin [Solirubrobacteraceae bacterium]
MTQADTTASTAGHAPSDDPSELRRQIGDAIAANEVVLFMKGTPEAPACGFSARTVAALQALGAPFAAVDVLPDPRIRQELTAISDWPTIPQLFLRGELVGGCDIVMEMFESGELAEALGAELAPDTPGELAGEGSSAAPGTPFTPVENRLA